MANDNRTPARNGSPDDRSRKGSQTSGNREESMNDSENDKFGKQSPRTSGTTPISGDTADSNEKPGPGGEEGTGGRS